MSARRSKKQTSTGNYPVKVLHLLLFGLFLFNAFVIFRFERDRQPVIVEHKYSVTTNRVFIVTNVIKQVSSTSANVSTNASGLLSVLDPQREVQLRYHFFVSGGKRGFRFENQTFDYFTGDLTSYGRVEFVGPERLVFDTGVYVKNNFEIIRGSYSGNSTSSNNSTVVVRKVAGLETKDNYFASISVGGSTSSSSNTTNRVRSKK